MDDPLIEKILRDNREHRFNILRDAPEFAISYRDLTHNQVTIPITAEAAILDKYFQFQLRVKIKFTRSEHVTHHAIADKSQLCLYGSSSSELMESYHRTLSYINHLTDVLARSMKEDMANKYKAKLEELEYDR